MRYLDTNVIIYAIEGHPKFGGKCGRILKDMEAGKAKVCCSVLVLAEFIGVLARINEHLEDEKKETLDVRKNVDALLSLPVDWIELDPVVARRAAEYRYRGMGSDFVHLASMELNAVEEIISADEELDKVSWLKRIDPLDYPA